MRGLLDLSLASRALHEGEVDFNGVPFVLEELVHAFSVEYVATAQLDALLLPQLTCVADSAQLLAIFTKSIVVVSVLAIRHALDAKAD